MKQTEKDFLEHIASFGFPKEEKINQKTEDIFHAVEKKERETLSVSLEEKDFSQSLGFLLSSKLIELQSNPDTKVQDIIKLADLAERYFKSTGKFTKKGIPIHYQNFNLHFSPFFFSHAFYKIAYGGAGTGKSRALMSQYPLKRIIEEENIHYLAVRKVEKTLELSVLADLMAVIKEENLEPYLEISNNKAKPWIRSTTTGFQY